MGGVCDYDEDSTASRPAPHAAKAEPEVEPPILFLARLIRAVGGIISDPDVIDPRFDEGFVASPLERVEGTEAEEARYALFVPPLPLLPTTGARPVRR